MILVRKLNTGQKYIHVIDDFYRETRESPPIPHEPRAWRFSPKRGDGTRSLNNTKGIAAIAHNYPQALKLIKQLEQ